MTARLHLRLLPRLTLPVLVGSAAALAITGCGVPEEHYADPRSPGSGGAGLQVDDGKLRITRPPRAMNGRPAVASSAELPRSEIQTIFSGVDATNRRRQLIQYLWGEQGLPRDKMPTEVARNVVSPVAGLVNVGRVDNLYITMEAGMESVAHHFIPARRAKNRLVILHHGHDTTFNDDASQGDVGYGMQRTLKNLLLQGYGVLAMYMPGYVPGLEFVDHESIMATVPSSGHAMKFFLEPVAVALNYLGARSEADGFPAYRDFSMVGLSGGGWTTTIYAAVDPRITLSIPVSGSLPLPLRSGTSLGDQEQVEPSFYRLAGYTDLYVLGAHGRGRAQIQVFNRHDDCCFGQSAIGYDPLQTGMSYDDALRAYEREVRKRLQVLNSGAFRLEIDEAATGHMISWNTIASVVLRELNDSDVGGSAGSGHLGTHLGFSRSARGTLVYARDGRVEDTNLLMVGKPAVMERVSGDHDVFFRDPRSRLMHAFKVGSRWTMESLDALVITDPVLAQSRPPRFQMAALTRDYRARYWRGDQSGITADVVIESQKVFGPPVLADDTGTGVELVLQDWDQVTHRLLQDDTGAWSPGPTSAAVAGQTF